MTSIRFKVRPNEDGLRLDLLLVGRYPFLGRARARSLLDSGGVLVNGRERPKGGVVRTGDRVFLAESPRPGGFSAAPDPGLELLVRFQDRHLLVVEKPAGVPTQPLRPGERGTLAGALAARFPETELAGEDPRESGLIHRLDTGTSGLLVAARDRGSFRALREALTGCEIDKRYRALCAGRASAPQRVHSFLVSDRKSRRRVLVSQEPGKRSRPAVTEILESRPAGPWSLLEIRVHSAMRHQIRAHLAWLGHPLAGDRLYGGPPVSGLDRHFLHASSIVLRHPVTGRLLRVSSPLPPDLSRVLRGL